MTDNPAARAEVLRTRDLTGWTVADGAGANVGTVSDLLIGRDGRVRYLAVKRGMLGGTVLIPVEQLDWGERSMRLNRWTEADVRRLPPYDADAPLSAEAVAEMERAHPRFYGPPLEDAPEPGETRIVPLREAREFRLPKSAPNPRGWSVFGTDHERVGVVEDMLVDPGMMKVRYLDVDVSDDLFLLREDRHVVVPMEAVELRERGEDVWVRGLTAREIAALPAYTGGAVDPLVEQRVLAAFAGHLQDDVPVEREEAGDVELSPRDREEAGDVEPLPRDREVDLPPPPPERDTEDSAWGEPPSGPPPLPRG